MSLCHQFSNEILRGIFRACKGTLPMGTEVSISQVCRRWRQIALDDENLWNVIANNPHEPITQGFSFLVDIHLQRSGGKGLYLTIMFDDLVGGENGRYVMDTLCSQMRRWIEVIFTAPVHSDYLDYLKLRLTDSKAPLLESLEIRGVPQSYVELGRTPHEEFVGQLGDRGLSSGILRGAGAAPRLKFIRLENYSYRYFLPPLHTLTTLCIINGNFGTTEYKTSMLFTECRPPYIDWQELKIIFSLPNLQNVQLGDCLSLHYNGTDNQEFEPVMVPQLRQLIVESDPETLLQILDVFVAKNLEVLGLHVPEDMLKEFIWGLDDDTAAFCHRCPVQCLPSVQVLVLGNFYFPSRDFRYFMKLCPNIQDFRFTFCSYVQSNPLASELIKFINLQESDFEDKEPLTDEEDEDAEEEYERSDVGHNMDGELDEGQQREDQGVDGIEEQRISGQWERQAIGYGSSLVKEEDKSQAEAMDTDDNPATDRSEEHDDDESNLNFIRQKLENMRHQLPFDLFKRLTRAEAKLDHVAWPNLTTVYYFPLAFTPNFPRISDWLENRHSRGAPRLSRLNIAPFWKSHNPGIRTLWHRTCASIRPYVNSIGTTPPVPLLRG